MRTITQIILMILGMHMVSFLSWGCFLSHFCDHGLEIKEMGNVINITIMTDVVCTRDKRIDPKYPHNGGSVPTSLRHLDELHTLLRFQGLDHREYRVAPRALFNRFRSPTEVGG